MKYALLAILLLSVLGCSFNQVFTVYEITGIGTANILYKNSNDIIVILNNQSIPFIYESWCMDRRILIQVNSSSEITLNIYKNNNLIYSKNGYFLSLNTY